MTKKIISDNFALYQLYKDMHIGKNIRKIREQKGMMQKEVATVAGIHASNYSKIEKGEREPSIDALDKIAHLFDMTIDQVIHFEGKIPKESHIQNKTITEKIQLIEQLEEDDKIAIFRIIDGMITKNKFKDFFQKNIAI